MKPVPRLRDYGVTGKTAKTAACNASSTLRVPACAPASFSTSSLLHTWQKQQQMAQVSRPLQSTWETPPQKKKSFQLPPGPVVRSPGNELAEGRTSFLPQGQVGRSLAATTPALGTGVASSEPPADGDRAGQQRVTGVARFAPPKPSWGRHLEEETDKWEIDFAS